MRASLIKQNKKKTSSSTMYTNIKSMYNSIAVQQMSKKKNIVRIIPKKTL